GGFDFDRWESLRWEMHTPEGSWAVWKSNTNTWSLYGGPNGLLALDRYDSEAHAKADAEAAALSVSEWRRSAQSAPEAYQWRYKYTEDEWGPWQSERRADAGALLANTIL